MPKPASYPNSDTSEHESVAVLMNLLHLDAVKADIKSRDKQPNTDGSIEVVDEFSFPIGKLDIQVRSLPTSTTHYDCQTSLVAYSSVTTNPFILICVDVENSKAFWKHLTTSMPEYKKDQKSFRIHFSEPMDLIDPSGHYIARWTEISRDYQNRVDEFPMLRDQIANELDVSSVTKEDRILAQEFIDGVNNLLDNEFKGFKPLLFPNTWKLGFAILRADDEKFRYQIYRVPRGDTRPLIIRQEDTPLFSTRLGQNTLLDQYLSRESISDPVRSGREFVYENIQKLLDERALPVFGQILSEDVIVGFIDEYHRLLALPRHRKEYSFPAVREGMEIYLFDLCSKLIWTTLQTGYLPEPIDLDSFKFLINRIDLSSLEHPTQPIRFSITSRNVPVKAAYSAIDFLASIEVNKVRRTFALPTIEPTRTGWWVWSGYQYEDEVSNVEYMLTTSISQYSEFVEGNSLALERSPYLDDTTSILYVYQSAISRDDGRGPSLKEYHLKNARDGLPKITILFKEGDVDIEALNVSDYPNVIYEGSKYTASRGSTSNGAFLFQSTPMLRLVYRMLVYDLQNAHGYEHFRNSL